MSLQDPSSALPGGKGLPTVLPPTGGHIVKMFVVPLLIVGGLLLGSFLFLRLTGGSVLRTPQDFLKDLRSGNDDVRKRAANDLAQLLARDDQLASDPAFGLDLADELPGAIAEADREQASPPEQQTATSFTLIDRDLTLQLGDNYLFYLTACVSHLDTPVGVPELKAMALDGGAGSAQAQMTRRWRAAWALANLGDNLTRFDRLSPDRQEVVLAGFQQEAVGQGSRAARAATALACLQDRRAGKPNALGVDAVLVRCSADGNPFLREMAVFALNFWDGPDVEEALVARLDDRGAGEGQLAALHEGAKNAVVAYRPNEGLGIRYQAAVALARHGSDRAPIDLLGEMLDESAQMDAHRVRSIKDGHETPDQAAAYADMENALNAVVELHHKNSRVNLTPLETALEKLKDSPNPDIRRQAEHTRQELAK